MPQVLAVAVGDQVQKIGSYLGYVAIPGIALLALLFFSQARELKRLKEWAGRAPERDIELQERLAAQATQPPAPAAAAAQTQAGKRVVAQPIPGRAPAAATPAGAAAQAKPAAAGQGQTVVQKPGQPAQPGVKPAPQPGAAPAAQPAAKPAQPAKPGQPAAVPAAAAAATPGTAKPGQAATPAKPGQPAQPAKPAESAKPAEVTAEDKAAAPATAVLPAATAAGAAQRPPAAAPAAAPAVAPLRSSTPSATMPPRTPPPGARPVAPPPPADEPPPHRTRNRLLAGLAVLIVGAGITVAALSLGGNDKPSANTPAPTPNSRTTTVAKSNKTAGGGVSRPDTTVAVLNGTTVPGLAAQVSDELDRFGFKRGAVTNAADQQKPATTVQYASGQKRAGQAVAEILRIKRTAPLDASTQAIAGPEALVVVTVGADKTQ
jgi:hypothetical protein